MKNALIALTVVCSTLMLADAKPIAKTHSLKAGAANYYLQGMRGFWLGYETGFYKNSKKDVTQCLNDETTANIVKMVDFFEGNMDMSQAFAIVNEGMQIFGNLETACSIQQSFDDLLNFCEANPDNCSATTLMQNATSNMFVLIGKFTEITEIFASFPAATTDDLYTQTNTIGNDIGTTIRVLSGFRQ